MEVVHALPFCPPLCSFLQAAFVEDDSMFDENGEVKETGYVDENGELRRPWCAATRILEHREQVRRG